ncbi:tRNA (adenosine(37)-N6)-dimethylallyltransferase MiaA [Patescibacteria group bacterium]|nr:tRNA (adenosine(37)-N6)-dimethylallyltransferase MiaA [Patescibacteria group bacterium]
MEKLPKLIVIISPTASGKTDISIKLAKKFSGEIISADSRAIYKEINIGTAKPSTKEQDGVKHYMIDVVSPKEIFTVAQFKQQSLKIINNILNQEKIPFLVGGTGLYVDSIVNNLEIPPILPDQKLRKKLEEQILNKGLEYVYKKLIKIDPGSKEFIQATNPRRIIRAMEVCIKSKQPFSQLRKQGKPLFNVLKIGIKTSPDILYKRITKRTRQMINKGLVQETRKLFKKYGNKSILSSTIGYQEIIPYLTTNSKKLSETAINEITELIIKNTKHYSSRQITWFKRDQNINWIINYKQAEDILKKFLKQ